MNPEDYDGYEEPPPYVEPSNDEEKGEDPGAPAEGIKGHWDKRLTPFQKLCLLKTFKEEQVRYQWRCDPLFVLYLLPWQHCYVVIVLCSPPTVYKTTSHL